MAITKEISYAGDFTEDGQINVTEIVRVMDNGIEIARKYNSHSIIDVGDDVTNEPQIVKDIASGLHTPARKAARDAVKAEEAELLQ